VNSAGVDKFINRILFAYVFSLYFLTYQETLNYISNLFAAVFMGVITIKILAKKQKLYIPKVLIIYAMFMFICLLSYFYAFEQDLVVSKFQRLLPIMILTFFLINYIDNLNKIKKVILYFFYSGFFASVYILFRYDFGEATRFSGDLGNVNAVGMAIGLSLVFGFSEMLENRNYKLIPMLLLMFVAVLLTGSRKALLFVILGPVLILLFINRSSFFKIARVALLGLLFVTVTYYLTMNNDLLYMVVGRRLENMFLYLTGTGTTDSSMLARGEMTQFGIELFKNKPLFGYGLSNYRALNEQSYSIRTYSHNNLIELLVGLGVVGASLYYSIKLIIIKNLISISRVSCFRYIGYSIVAVIIGYALLSPSLVYYYNKHFNIVLALGIATFRLGVKHGETSFKE